MPNRSTPAWGLGRLSRDSLDDTNLPRVDGHYSDCHDTSTPGCGSGAMRNKWSQSVTGGGAASSGPPVVGAPGGLPAGALGGPPARYALRWTAFACFGERRLGALRVHPYEYDANYPPQKDRGFARGACVDVPGSSTRHAEPASDRPLRPARQVLRTPRERLLPPARLPHRT